MTIGDPSVWADRLRILDTMFLQRVLAVWSDCVAALPPNPHEDAITINLTDILSRDAHTMRSFHWIEYQYEPFGHTPQGIAFSRGKIDIAVFLNQDRDTYLAYECKRLNVKSGGTRRSLAREYVMDGLNRFVSSQYSENLPVGCMLGYVLDGDLDLASSRVRATIIKHRHDVLLIGRPQLDSPIGEAIRFRSRHNRKATKREIEVRHAMLPM